MIVYVNRGHASAQQNKRELVDSGGGNLRPLHHVDEVSEHWFAHPMYLLPELPRRPCSMGSYRLSYNLWMISSRRMLWMPSPNNRRRFRRAPRIPKNYGASSPVRGLGSLGHRSASKRKNGPNGGMVFGRILVRGDELSSFSRGRARARGYLGAGMVWLEESIIAFLQMIELGGTHPLGG